MVVHKSFLSRRFLGFMLIGIILTSSVIGILAIVYAIVYLLKTYIKIDNNRIIYKEGIFNRVFVSLPLETISTSWEIKQDTYQVFTGLCSFKIANKNGEIIIHGKDFSLKSVKNLMQNNGEHRES